MQEHTDVNDDDQVQQQVMNGAVVEDRALFRIDFEDNDWEEWDFEELRMNRIMDTKCGDHKEDHGKILNTKMVYKRKYEIDENDTIEIERKADRKGPGLCVKHRQVCCNLIKANFKIKVNAKPPDSFQLESALMDSHYSLNIPNYWRQANIVSLLKCVPTTAPSLLQLEGY